jgi:VWFA-related protein
MIRTDSSRSRTKILTLLLLVFLFPNLFPQNKKTKETAEKDQLTFRLPVNLVTVNVTISDKNGNPVTDLTQMDFKVFEDGKLQEIHTFAKESYTPIPETAAAIEGTNTARGLSHGSSSSVRPSRPRMISILIDDFAMDSLDYYPRLVKALQDYVANDLGPSDQVAILSASGRIQYPFSDDQQILQDEIAKIIFKLNFGVPSRSTCPQLTDLQAYRIAILSDQMELKSATNKALECLGWDPNDSNRGAANIAGAAAHAKSAAFAQNQESEFRSLSTLDTLRQHVRALKHFDAAKSLVFFSDGFLAESASTIQYQVQEAINLALSSGIVVNCVNIRGLESGIDVSRTVSSPVAASSNPIEPLNAWGATREIHSYLNDMLAQETPLAQLSHDTGGQFFHNDNNLYKGFKQIVEGQSHHYILTYATPSQKADGSYHRIKLEVSRPRLDLSYRKGYYAPREEMTFERRKKEDIIDALQAPGNLNEIPISLSYNSYRKDYATYGVSFVTNVGIRGLRFLDEDSRRKNLISLILVAYDERENYVDGLEKTIDFKLLETSHADLLRRGISSRVELTLPNGQYKIKAVVRESVQGKMGSLTKDIEVP